MMDGVVFMAAVTASVLPFRASSINCSPLGLFPIAVLRHSEAMTYKSEGINEYGRDREI